MRCLLRTALAAILTLICAGPTFADVTALVQFNPGDQTAIETGDNTVQSALSLGSLTIYPHSVLDLENGGLLINPANFTYWAPVGDGINYVQESGYQAIGDAVANMSGVNGNGNTFGSGGGLITYTSTAATVSGDGFNGIYSSYNGRNGVTGGAFIGTLDDAYGNGYKTWRGQTVSSTSDVALIGYTYPGDLFMEGAPDGGDVGTFLAPILNNNPSTLPDRWSQGDIYYEGVPDGGDTGFMLAPVLNNDPALYALGAQGAVFVPPSSAGISAVPEPASLQLLAALAIGITVYLSRRASFRRSTVSCSVGH